MLRHLFTFQNSYQHNTSHMKKKSYLYTLSLLASFIFYGVASAGECFNNKIVKELKVHGNYDLSFKLDNGRWFDVIDNTYYASGRAIHQMLMISLLTGTKVRGAGDNWDCDNNKVKSILLLSE